MKITLQNPRGSLAKRWDVKTQRSVTNKRDVASDNINSQEVCTSHGFAALCLVESTSLKIRDRPKVGEINFIK